MTKIKKIKISKISDIAVTYLILIIVSFFFLFPVLWIVLSSVSGSGLYSVNGFFPKSFSFESFKKLFTQNMDLYNYPRWFLNTLFISFFSCIFGTILVILTAFTMSRFRFKSRKKLMAGTLILGMFPSFLAMSAVYILMAQFKLANSHWGLILIYSAAAPLGYMFQKGFFDTIPSSIDEAARIDGASSLMIFVKIILPLSAPIIVYTSLTAFTFPWSDFILPQVLLKERGMWTVAVGLNNLPDSEFNRFTAGSVLIAVPIVTLYFCLTKFLISGLSSGAVKE